MVLVFAEQREGTLKKVAFEAVLVGTAVARESKQADVAAAVIGSGVSGLAGELARFGVGRVFTVDDQTLGSYTPDGYAGALEQLCRQHRPTHVVLSATAMGKDLGATLAARLEAAILPDCIAVEFESGELVCTRPIYAGKALSRVKAPGADPLVLTVRPRSVAMQAETGSAGEVIRADVRPAELRSRVAEVVKLVTRTVELTEADIIVSGGRGMKGPENYAILEELASVINAAVGASRAAVDAGWRDHQFQVGQTGKVVAPTVYIACGISGAIQHLVGMMNSKCIVAINKDPEANIMKVADYAVVGDLFAVVPLLTEEFRKLKAA
ncbi:electron transfer flavoprotein subunit alpha/FixB family protein [candidate division WOR-3 bacterium]|nr:electron transfer flavoprotein subunit alpha/FixB family protein [candidate division WOR-3 bacterium]